jgi:hypothetical protein
VPGALVPGALVPGPMVYLSGEPLRSLADCCAAGKIFGEFLNVGAEAMTRGRFSGVLI